MNNSCVIRAHGAGLFSNINKVLTCLRIYDHVHVDWSKAAPNDPAFKYGGSFYGDCWSALFEPTTLPEGNYDVVHEYPFYEITGGCAGVLYQNEQWGWRERYHGAWNKLKCRIDPMPVGDNTIGVLIRSDAIAGEQLSGQNQTLEQYVSAIAKLEAKDTSVFIVSSDQQSIFWMMEQPVCHDSWFTGIKRAAKRSDPEQHLNVPQTAGDAIDVMREVLTLSQCKYLISGVSNMATAALYMNLNLKHIYLK